ncbi:hypothetical protein [Streptomyces sp. NPDC048481]|uniref:hypothetical protein n=1 Tax=Streptomyces sp. NPDC048481 TaxID=3365557 RepID=UPI003713E48C
MTTERTAPQPRQAPEPSEDPRPRPEPTDGADGNDTPPPPAAAAPGETPAPDAPARAPKDRRALRAVLRWTAVVTVFAALGAGTAYGITRMERTDLPGLATASDGRWDYPELERAPLPSGSPSPFATENPGLVHYADLRALRVPAPEGATQDPALLGDDGWLAAKDFLPVFEKKDDRAHVGQELVDTGLRHIAARGWTTEDGTRTGVYLLRFPTDAMAARVYAELTEFNGPVYPVRGAAETRFDDDFPVAADSRNVTRQAYDEVKPYGAQHVRQAYLHAGDVVALVVQSRRGVAAAVPFQQTVALQSRLLN